MKWTENVSAWKSVDHIYWSVINTELEPVGGGGETWLNPFLLQRKQEAWPPPSPPSFSLLQLFKTGWRVSHTDADMTAVGELVLVLGLLVSAHCEVRARDPEVEEEEGELGGGGGGGVLPLHPRTTETSPLGETGSNPARSGWVHKPLPPHSAKEK